QALIFLQEISDPAFRLQMLERVVVNSATADPKAAALALRQVSEPSSGTYEQLALGFGLRDPEAGIEWAQSLPPEHRVPLLQRIVIEAARRKDSAVVANCLLESALPQTLKQELLETLRRQGRRP
ncbi:MAG TPA: hypothetical protein VG457_15935, partial [Planctomycetota bacterium]|nr:hypothetical protein [Planctomycetota bacterium]